MPSAHLRGRRGLLLAAALALTSLQQLLAQQAPEAGPSVEPAATALRADGEVAPTLEQIFRPPRLLGLRPRDVALSAGGGWATWRWTAEDAVEPEDHLWLAPTDGSDTEVLFPHEAGAEVRWTRREGWLLVERDGWLSLLDVAAGGPPRPLLEGGSLRGLVLLEDGRRVVLRGADEQIWVLDLQSGERRTPAAGLAGRPGWWQVLEQAGLLAVLLEPEGGPRPGGTHASPTDGDGEAASPPAGADARTLWLLPLDEGAPPRQVAVPGEGRLDLSADGAWVLCRRVEPAVQRRLVMADYLTESVSTVPVRSSLAGDPAGTVELVLVEVQSGARHAPPVAARTRFHLQRTAWSPRGQRLLVEWQSEDHHVRELLVVDPAEGTARVVHAEQDEAWIGGPLTWCGWSEDGQTVLFTSERTGRNHLWQVAAEGGEAEPLTVGDCDVRLVLPVEGTERLLLVVSSPFDPAVRQLELLDLGSRLSLRLTSEKGCVSGSTWDRRRKGEAPLASADGTTVLYGWEELGLPGDLYALHLTGGREAADADAPPRLAVRGEPVRLTDSVPAALGELALEQPRVVEYENRADGVTVRALLYLPEPLEEGRRYPAVVFVHGAGQLQNVTRSTTFYDQDKLFHHRLARRGYVVLAPDFRHSDGYGRDFRAAVHGHLGGKDLDDLVAGVEWLVEQGWVERSRVGLYGGSYGGFLTLMALFTRPEVFACGAALRPVTDWRTYHAAYTNPRLGTPDDDPEAYARSSPIDHVEGLQDPLLLLHGLKDGNVFAQDSIRLIERLVELGKEFDAMLYPSQGHGFTSPAAWLDEYRRIERLFDRHLRDG